jgi:hypothetical protein
MNSKEHSESTYEEFNSLRLYFSQEINKNSKEMKS